LLRITSIRRSFLRKRESAAPRSELMILGPCFRGDERRIQVHPIGYDHGRAEHLDPGIAELRALAAHIFVR
jgi:hypothetical protein